MGKGERMYMYLIFQHYFLHERQHLWLPVCFLANPFWKRVYSRRKEFGLIVSKFSPFRVYPYSDGMHNNFDAITSFENVSRELINSNSSLLSKYNIIYILFWKIESPKSSKIDSFYPRKIW